MTAAEQFHSIVAPRSPDVPIAGVPWPRYKVIALVVGAAVALIVGLLTMAAAPTVLCSAATATAAWLMLGRLAHSRR